MLQRGDVQVMTPAESWDRHLWGIDIDDAPVFRTVTDDVELFFGKSGGRWFEERYDLEGRFIGCGYLSELDSIIADMLESTFKPLLAE